MRLHSSLFSAVVLLSSAVALPADTLAFSFVSIDDGSKFSFTLPSAPIPDVITDTNFTLNSVSLDLGGTGAIESVQFFTASSGGGLESFVPGNDPDIKLFGAALFTGTTTLPTLTIGSFLLTDPTGAPVALTVSDTTASPVPEPSSLVLFGLSVLGTAGALSRRLLLIHLL